MKIITIFFLILIAQNALPQDCVTTARSKSEPWSRTTNVYATTQVKAVAGESAKMKSQQDKIESWIRSMLTGFTGAKVGYTNELYLDPSNWENEQFFKSSGINGHYGSTTRFWAYYCNNNKMYTEGEAGSFIYVHINNVFHTDGLNGLTDDEGLFTVNGRPAFRVLEKSQSVGRVDFYDRRKRMNYNDTINTSKTDIIIIRNSDKPLFIRITRKEYLEQMLKDAEKDRAKRKEMQSRIYEDGAKNFEKEMQAYKSDRLYTPEKEAKRRKWFEEDQAKRDELIQKIDPEVDASVDVIEQYLKKPAEWLSRTVKSFFNTDYSALAVRSYFENLDDFKESKEDYTRSEIVYINPDYFNKALSRDVPQVILVELVKVGYWYMYKLSEKVKQLDALAPLMAMLNPGNSAPTEPMVTATTSAYTLKYLPKLTKLTPQPVPAGMPAPTIPVAMNYGSTVPAAKLKFEIPARSPKLAQVPQLTSEENYKSYIQQLSSDIGKAIKPAEKIRIDEYLKNKKLTQSEDVSKQALGAWLQKAPHASLYLYSKSVVINPSDVLAANNFSAFLLMGGLAEKSIPILDYWNKKMPAQPTILSNLGNAYYRLGDVDNAMKYLQQCVQRDTLNATANKILCLIYLKKGDTKKAEEHGTKSLTTTNDEQVISVLRQLNKQLMPGEIMSRRHKNEFPLLKRIRLPEMPSNLDDMDKFKIDLAAEKASVDLTIQSIEAKMPQDTNNVSQKALMAWVNGGIAPLRKKAQDIIMDGMQLYQKEKLSESEAFNYKLKLLTAPYSAKVRAINKKYVAQISKLEGGEAGDEDKIAALELAQCQEVNAEKAKYVVDLSQLVNQYAQRQEYISRKFCRDYANWAPLWLPKEKFSFPLIEKGYLQDISSILSQYKIVTKSKCAEIEDDDSTEKEPHMKEWEDEYCANFKGKLKIDGIGLTWTCNSWGVEFGEGIIGEFEANYGDDGSFEEFTLGGGIGKEFHLSDGKVTKLELEASVKEFIKIGPNKVNGEWEVRDFGIKTELALEGQFQELRGEVKLIEASAAVNAGYDVTGVLAPILPLK